MAKKPLPWIAVFVFCGGLSAGSDYCHTQKRFIYRLLTRHGCLPVWLVAAWYSHGGTWSNHTYVAPARFSLLATCVVFWSHRCRDIGYTAVIFLPERMYITLDSSACTSYPSLKRHKCLWRFGKAILAFMNWVHFLFHNNFSSHNWLKSGI